MPGRWHTFAGILDIVVLILYPAIVWAGLNYLGVRTTVLLLFLLMGRRFIALILSSRAASVPVLVQAALIASVQGMAVATGSALALRSSPFVISLTFVVHFALSLRSTPLVETFARLERPDLPPEQVAYCRRLTGVWIAVLCANSVLLLVAMLVEED